MDGKPPGVAISLVILGLLAVGTVGCVGESLELTETDDREPSENGSNETVNDAEEERTNSSRTDAGGGGNHTSDDHDRNSTSESRSNSTNEEEGSDAEESEAPYDPGWPPVEEAAIRPGAELGQGSNVFGETNYCTVGYIFSDPTNRTLYTASAAHCFGDVAIGTEITIAGIQKAGTLVYCSWGTAARGDLSSCPANEDLSMNSTRDNDLALVRLEDEHRDEVHPSMIGFGGPSSIDRNATLGEKVFTFGSSPWRDAGREDVSSPLDPREGYVEGQGEWTTRFHLVGHTNGGDSGSPVRTAEGALGLLIRTGSADNPAAVVATNLGAATDFVNQETNLSVELKTWPNQNEGRLPGTR